MDKCFFFSNDSLFNTNTECSENIAITLLQYKLRAKSSSNLASAIYLNTMILAEFLEWSASFLKSRLQYQKRINIETKPTFNRRVSEVGRSEPKWYFFVKNALNISFRFQVRVILRNVWKWHCTVTSENLLQNRLFPIFS